MATPTQKGKKVSIGTVQENSLQTFVMNVTYTAVFILSVFLFVSCDPPRDMYQQGEFTFSVKVVNPMDSINLGDSVCFIFEIPDTISINGKRLQPYYGNNDGVSIDLQDNKMDTSLGSETRPYTPDCDVYVVPGSSSSGLSLTLGKTGNNKLYSRLYLVPKKKGVYFLANPQIGYFSINNESIRGRVLFTIDVPDRHHALLINTARPQNRNSFAAYIQAQESLGQPIYGFAVK